MGAAEYSGVSSEDLLDDWGFRSDFEDAFGYDPADGPPADFDAGEYHEARGVVYLSGHDYAEFMADWLGYSHDEIDYWLGYEDTT